MEQREGMTEKLFYGDSYLRRFTAMVTSCRSQGEGYLVTLDRTAFYPEGGGQPADRGSLGGAAVLDVQEKGGELLHLTDRALAVGEAVEGEIDWPYRFSLMQHHTGEHIVSGLVDRLFGYDNVGFHMSDDSVTIDFNGALTEEQTGEVERLANEIVYGNAVVDTGFPPPEALEGIGYRCKKELSGDIRIVTVPDCDVCACCGLHAARTGEVGMIKLLSPKAYKGGTRMILKCGDKALADYGAKSGSVAGISALLSAKPEEVVQAVERLVNENAGLKRRLGLLRQQLMENRAEEIPVGSGRVCLFADELTADELRRFCLLLCEKAELAAVLSGTEEEGYKYAIGSKTVDVKALAGEWNKTLQGRGGGTERLVQGTVRAGREMVEGVFGRL